MAAVICRDCQASLKEPANVVVDPLGNRLPYCVRCATQRKARGDIPIFCSSIVGVESEPEYRGDVLAALPDAALLERLSQAFETTWFVNENRKICPVSPQDHPERWNNFAAAWNEATLRGYTQADLGGAITSFARARGSLGELHEKLGKPESWNPDSGRLDLTWKQFEQLIAKFHSMDADDCVVSIDEKIPDRTTSTLRQIDVTLRFKMKFYEFLVIIECRHQKANVTIGDVEAFARKLEDVRGHKGVLVTSAGFDSGAEAKAQFYGIDIFTVSTAVRLDWRVHVREIFRSFPIPEEVLFDPVEAGGFFGAPTGSEMLSYADFRLLDETGQETDRLLNLLSELSSELMRKRLAVPTKVRVVCDPPVILRVDRFDLSRPIKAIEIVFGLATRIEERIVHTPTIMHRYDYRNVGTGKVDSFNLE